MYNEVTENAPLLGWLIERFCLHIFKINVSCNKCYSQQQREICHRQNHVKKVELPVEEAHVHCKIVVLLWVAQPCLFARYSFPLWSAGLLDWHTDQYMSWEETCAFSFVRKLNSYFPSLTETFGMCSIDGKVFSVKPHHDCVARRSLQNL